MARANQAEGKAFEEEAEQQERTSFRVYGRVAVRALYACRMAGRQPLLDIVSIVTRGPVCGTLRLISAKSDAYIRPRERQALAELLARLPWALAPVLEVHYRDGRGHLRRKTINKPSDLEFFARKGRDK